MNHDKNLLIAILMNTYLPITSGKDIVGEYQIPLHIAEKLADALINNGVTVRICNVLDK